jgi:hypothetical protein
METNRTPSDDIRLHTEDPAEGDDPREGMDIRAHTQDSAEGPDDAEGWLAAASAPRAKPARARPDEDQPETD